MPAIVLFAYGTLQDDDILAAALGRPVPPAMLVPATAPGHAAVHYPGRVYPALVPRVNGNASGHLLLGLDDSDLATLDAFEGGEYRRAPVTVLSGGKSLDVEAYLPTIAIPADARPWTLSGWMAEHRPTVLAEETRLARDLRTRLLAAKPGT